MKRKILRQIAKTRMRQEGLNLHVLFKKPARTLNASDKNHDRTLFAERWRKYAKKGVIPVTVALTRRRKTA